ncbi:MAG: hypothetical protein IJ719_08040 [Clostridia bacterium]|nr:hypothetical protein [Clostridia bacterium]
MIFERKYERARELQKEQMGDALRALEDEDLADKLEKNDVPAMILAALLTIVPVALLFLLTVAGIGYFFMVR